MSLDMYPDWVVERLTLDAKRSPTGHPSDATPGCYAEWKDPLDQRAPTFMCGLEKGHAGHHVGHQYGQEAAWLSEPGTPTTNSAPSKRRPR